MVAKPDLEPVFLGFFYLLQEYGIPVNLHYLIDFYSGLQQGLVRNIDELFLFLRLNLVKKAEHMDAFERAFAFYFFDIDIPDLAEDDPAVINTRQFQEWLRRAIANKEITGPVWQMGRDQLIKKFWETLKQQMERHDGGKRWVGTGGASPFGHSGLAQPGVRVHGPGGNRSAIKAIGERNYIDYASSHSLKGSNIRQALAALKKLQPAGAPSELDIPQTIFKTAQNGGEIELVFARELRDKISVLLLIDNGGMSMLPHAELTRLLFDKLKDRFKTLKTYYFHNTIYQRVYADPYHTQSVATDQLLKLPRDTRVILMGDASMAPDELYASRGSLYFEDEHPQTSMHWLSQIQARFRHSVWLNPLLKEHWEQSGAWTLHQIRSVFEMEDLSLNGIKKAVDYLNQQT